MTIIDSIIIDNSQLDAFIKAANDKGVGIIKTTKVGETKNEIEVTFCVEGNFVYRLIYLGQNFERSTCSICKEF
jgi:hypothetical protein